MAHLCLCTRLQGKTVLMVAIEAKLEALAEKLIEMGADINAKMVCCDSLIPAGLPELCPEPLTESYVGCAICRHPQIACIVVELIAPHVLQRS